MRSEKWVTPMWSSADGNAAGKRLRSLVVQRRIIYELHVKAFADATRWHWRLPRLMQKLDYLQTGRHLHLAAAVSSLPGPRRRLRHCRLCECHPSYGTMDDFKAFWRRRTTRAAGDDRVSHQPHFGPAPVVQSRGATRARLAGADYYVWATAARV